MHGGDFTATGTEGGLLKTRDMLEHWTDCKTHLLGPGPIQEKEIRDLNRLMSAAPKIQNNGHLRSTKGMRYDNFIKSGMYNMTKSHSNNFMSNTNADTQTKAPWKRYSSFNNTELN